MQLNLNLPLKSLTNEIIGKQTIGQELAKLLGDQQQNIDAIKAFGWALKLANNEDLEIDQSDLEALKLFVKNHPSMLVWFKGRILEILNDLK